MIASLWFLGVLRALALSFLDYSNRPDGLMELARGFTALDKFTLMCCKTAGPEWLVNGVGRPVGRHILFES